MSPAPAERDPAEGHEDGEANRQEEEAARADRGPDQEPKQAEDDSSSTWDGDQHSDAPGPFGTGEE